MSMRWIVSAEAVPYHFWQCALFAYSARVYGGHRATIMLHEATAPAHPSPWDLIDADIFRVESYRQKVAGVDYPPRNFPGSLLEAARLFRDDWFVLFDPDMIFLRNPEFAHVPSADRVGYGPEGARVGVPHVIPRNTAWALAEDWLMVLDRAKTYSWELSMWAFVHSMQRLGLPYLETTYCESNYEPQRAPREDASIIHYCYGDQSAVRWSKRNYLTAPLSAFDDIPLGLGVSIEDMIFRQLRECAADLKRRR